jgi:hypothetical protein
VRWRRRCAIIVLIGLTAVALGACTRFGATLHRPEGAVVMTGAALPGFAGTDPFALTAFAWDGEQWHQVPVQVDERALVNPATILHWPKPMKRFDGSPFEILGYAPPRHASPGYRWWDTYVPPDPDPGIDADDEVVFLAADVGRQAPAGTPAPAGVDPATRREVHVVEPAEPAQEGWIYLFRGTSLTGGSAGTTGVEYSFRLDSGDYLATYRMGANALVPNDLDGPNPEHSTVSAPGYTLTFGDRWLHDGMASRAVDAGGADVLERARVQLVPGECGRSEDSFNGVVARRGPKAFIANINGPVRAVRSYMGANSGNTTSATEFFYPRSSVTVGDLRVHTIPGVMVFDDMATGSTGMRYSDSVDRSGVPIDGVPDALAPGLPSWEMVSGPQGSFVTVGAVETTAPELTFDRWYLDDRAPVDRPCTGDGAAWGQHGVRVIGVVPCTDPRNYGHTANCPAVAGQPDVDTLRWRRTRYFEPPDISAARAEDLATQARSALEVTVDR